MVFLLLVIHALSRLAEVVFIGIMRAFRARGETVVRLTNHLVIIVPLLVLFYSKNSLAFEAQLDMFKRNFEALFEEDVIYKKAEHIRNETIYKLLDEARSLTDQKQLKIFKQNLQGLVDQADRQMIKEKDHIAAVIKKVTSKMVELYPTLQLLESMPNRDPSVNKLIHFTERLFEKSRTYITLKTKLFAEDAKNTERNIIEVMKTLKSLNEVKDEL